MKKRYQRILAAVLALGIILTGLPKTAVWAKDEEEPILTIACLSDLHNQMSLIDQANVENVRLRGTVSRTLQAIKEQEEIDLMILCGDYTSDSSNIPEANWLRIRELMVQATRDAFPDSDNTPVLWVDGNHDYEITREYNAGDYYTYPMKDDVGELPEEDCYYEETSGKNGETVFNLLTAYYYELYGFDFLCLNTGNIIYDYPNGMGSYTDYRYSVESVEWVNKKLEEIYKDDPDKKKTVFFVTHIPFSDSNSVNVTKGLDEDHEATILLKETLAKYPNLIHLYGHDHGGNSAFIRTATAQRVTQYDMDGNKLTDEKHSPLWQIEKVDGGYTIQSMIDGRYLGYANNNLALLDEEQICQIEQQTSGGYHVKTDGAKPYVYFSSSSNTFSANTAACEIEILKQTKVEDGIYSFEAAAGEEIEDGIYALAKTAGEKIYMMTDQTNGSTGVDFRMLPIIADLDEENNTIYKEPEQKDASFITSFVGSMRYYSNDINYPSSPNDSNVVQALMIYVYSDRVELHMKNYGEYDYYDVDHIFQTQPIFIAKNPIPYYINRKVENNFAYVADLKDLIWEVDTMSLTGYTAESVRNLMTQLKAAKLAIQNDEKYRKLAVFPTGTEILSQEMIDDLYSKLIAAKDGLEIPKPPVKPPVKEPQTQGPAVQVPKLAKPALKAAAKKTGKVALSWKKQSNADGYVIQMKKDKGKFKQLAKIKKAATVKKTTSKLAKGTYKFKMRSFATYTDANGKKQTVYSPYSKTVTAKVK